MLNTARVQLELPTKGPVWFFINPAMTVSDFKKQCTDEDSLVSEVNVVAGKKAVDDQTSLYDLLVDQSSPLKLNINQISYQFENQPALVDKNAQHLPQESSPWFEFCAKQQGLQSLHANTISSIVRQVEKEVQFSPASAPASAQGKKKGKATIKSLKSSSNSLSSSRMLLSESRSIS